MRNFKFLKIRCIFLIIKIKKLYYYKKKVIMKVFYWFYVGNLMKKN